MTATIFLDRDGTLIHNMDDPADPSCVKLIRGAAAAVASMRGLGYQVVVVTNQGAVARGLCTEEQVAAVHDRLATMIIEESGTTIDRFYYCPFDPAGKIKKYRRDHPWRKPNPGMLVRAAEDLTIDLENSWMIGDRAADIQAGRSAGTRTILLRDDMDTIRPAAGRAEDGDPDFVAPNLVEAVRAVAKQHRPEVWEDAHGFMDGLRPADTTLTEPTAEAATQRQPARSPQPVRPVAPQKPPCDPPPVQPPVQPPVHPPVHPPDSPQDSSPDLHSDPALTRGSEPQPVSGPSREDGSGDPSTLRVLQQILQEQRSQRGGEGQFSLATAMAVALQIIAVACVLGAVFMGGTGPVEMFVRWIGCAILAQLAAITAMLFERR